MGYPFVQAKNYRNASRTSIDVIVVHDMEAPEKGDTAERISNFFATTTKPASAHYNIDNNSIVQCVKDEDIAYHAPGANHNGIGLEHAGYASQTAADWHDAYSDAMLRISAKLSAELVRKYNIPVVWLSPADLQAGKRGFTSHNNVSKAFGKSSHWDPGPGFPVDTYLRYVKENLGQVTEPVNWEIIKLFSKPWMMPREFSPEHDYLKHYLSSATRTSAVGVPYREYFLIPVKAGQTNIDFISAPAGSIFVGTSFQGVAQISGANRLETKKLLDKELFD